MSDHVFFRRVGIVLLLGLIVLLFYVTRLVWLLVFAGALVAVVLSFITRQFERLRLPHRVALVLALSCFVGLFVLLGWLLYPRVRKEVAQAAEQVPAAIETLRNHRLGQEMLEEARGGGLMQSVGHLLEPVATTVNALAQVGTFTVLVLVLGVFFAYNPGHYMRGLVRAFPPQHRPEAASLFHNYGRALALWIKGQLISMSIVGGMTTVALWILGLPYAFILGLMAGLFQFIPYVGPVLWVFPAFALSVAAGLSEGITVLAVYAVVQTFEGNLLTPVVQRHAVQLPPVLTLLSTILMGMVFGLIGLILGTPLAVLGLVTYRQLYLRRFLAEPDVEVPGED